MPNVRDFLDRFRPAGSPGSASAIGVPADRRADAEEELAPVFAALQDADRRCADLQRQADEEARRELERARKTASELVDHARSRCADERAATAARAAGEAASEADRILDRGRRAAGEDRATAERRSPELVAQAVARARAWAAEAGEVP